MKPRTTRVWAGAALCQIACAVFLTCSVLGQTDGQPGTGTSPPVPSTGSPGETSEGAAQQQPGAASSHGEAAATSTPACTYTITPGSQSFTSSGGSGSIEVSTQGDCRWGASPNASWITLDPATGAAGTGTLGYRVASNPSPTPRAARITVEGRVFSVSQAGAEEEPQYPLTVKKSGNGQGTITNAPAGTTFKKGATVTFNAVPATGSAFSGWSGACSGMSQTCSVKVTAALTVTASFTQKTFTITVASPSNGIIYPTGPVRVPYGAKRTFQIIPLPGYRVGDVLVDRTSVGAVNSYTFNNIAADHVIQAVFVSQ